MKKNLVEDIYPLTSTQQGILFHSLYAPKSGVYLEQLSCILEGDLNISAFERAWRQVVERHSILRTAFYWERRDEPLQVVYRHVKLLVEQHNWQRLSRAEQAERVMAFRLADRVRGFDLSKPLLMRLTLNQLAKDTFQFVWSYHHLLLDGWSLPILLKEVFAFYEACQQRQALHLEQPRPYGDYVAWLQQQDLSAAEAFWRKTLAGFAAPTPLTIDQASNRLMEQQKSDMDYAELSMNLSVAATATLQLLTRQQQLTLNTVVQGAWALLLSWYSGEADVVFGAAVSGRPPQLSGVEAMPGLFINTLPVRVRISPGAKMAPWLKDLQTQQVELHQYEHSPLVQVQSWSEVPRGTPLFESLVVFENYPMDALREQVGSLAISNVCWEERTNYPLTLVAIVTGSELSLRASYECHRFDAATIQRMLGHWQALLEGIAANPERHIAHLPLLMEEERRQLLVEWNDTRADYSRDQCIHHLFEAQAKRTPDAVALVFEGQHLTYHALNRRANQLAHYLQALGVGSETLVGICVERSSEMVMGILGILKAGGAYVPLDPAYPKDRLVFMLEDTRTSVLLTQGQLSVELPKHELHVVYLDTVWETITCMPETAPPSLATADNLAYTIYTSGSTGKPKGVQILHHAVVNFLNSMRQRPGLTEQDIFLSVTTLSFDIAALELFLPLTVGARVVLVSRAVAADGHQLEETMTACHATAMQATPATWCLLLAAGWQGNERLAVLCGGEALPRELGAQLLVRSVSLWNLYGPTETTIWSCIHKMGIEEGTVVIGRPIANTQIYLLDAHLNPVPIGVPGGLYIGGAGLARGYLHHPELTAAKFIPNPFSEEVGARLYQTGDLARYLPDGNIECLGRIDHQVKVRGFRIELGEIEAVLHQHPAVRETVVVAREDMPDDTFPQAAKRLVAYVVPYEGQALTARELQSYLREKLPEYMMPAIFVFLDVLPLTPNGKVNRHALPVPDRGRPELGELFQSPRTPTEEILAGIWAAILGLGRVGIHDNFFESGGHSLLATRVMSRIRDTFRVDLPLQSIFEMTTVAELAQAIDQASQAELYTNTLTITRVVEEEGRL
jgi:amino acid adenylation domain-containing protein